MVFFEALQRFKFVMIILFLEVSSIYDIKTETYAQK